MIKVCFWCKKAKNPEHTIGTPEYFDYDPCFTCDVHISKGIMVVQVTDKPNGDKPIGEGIYPTGKWVVIDRDKLIEGLGDWVGLNDALKSGNMFIDKETWETMKLP